MRSASLALALVVSACGSQNNPSSTAIDQSPDLEQRLPVIDRRCATLPGDAAVIKPSKDGKSYFPKSFGKPAQVCVYKGYPECFATVGEVEIDWYPDQLDAADEPSLYERSTMPTSASTSALRFTWLRSFDHPVTVRIERSGKSARLIAKELTGQGGVEPGVIERVVDRPLSSSEVAKLDFILSKTKVLELRATDCSGGTDGSQWIVESVDRNDYRFVNRYAPTEGPVREFGDFALKLTGWDVGARY